MTALAAEYWNRCEEDKCTNEAAELFFWSRQGKYWFGNFDFILFFNIGLLFHRSKQSDYTVVLQSKSMFKSLLVLSKGSHFHRVF